MKHYLRHGEFKAIVNTLKRDQYGLHSSDDIWKCLKVMTLPLAFNVTPLALAQPLSLYEFVAGNYIKYLCHPSVEKWYKNKYQHVWYFPQIKSARQGLIHVLYYTFVYEKIRSLLYIQSSTSISKVNTLIESKQTLTFNCWRLIQADLRPQWRHSPHSNTFQQATRAQLNDKFGRNCKRTLADLVSSNMCPLFLFFFLCGGGGGGGGCCFFCTKASDAELWCFLWSAPE